MKRWKKQKKNLCTCTNCGYNITVSPDTVKEKTFEDKVETVLIATFVECPVCGERLLKQLDTQQTYELARKGVKLELLQRQGKKLNDKQKAKLKSIEQTLFNARKKLNELYWDETYQSLNQYEEEKTEMVNQEPMLGDEVTSTEQAGERMAEHV